MKGESEKLLSAAADAAKACPNVTAARAIHAEALAISGKFDEANAEADEALTMEDDPSRAHAAKAAVLLKQGKIAEAQEEAAKASEGAGARDAKLMLVQMAINGNDLDGAETALKALQATNPQDADVAYDLALIADKRNKYNDARNGYLATLKLDPTYRDARYNLALLTQRRGVTEEAKNHARKFAEMAPDDPRVGPLQQLVGGGNGGAPTQPPTQSP
jgi:Flp pilus assembly protein TadD